MITQAMRRLKDIFTNHISALFFALLVAVIVAAPQVYFRVQHAQDGVYQGVELLPDSPWAPRVREVQDGHLNFGAIYYKEGKDDPYLFQPLGSIVVAYMGEVLSFDINNTLLLSRVLLSFLSFLLIYSFVVLLSRDKLAALSSATVLLLAESISSYSGLSALVHGVSPEDFLRIGRPVNPVMIYILLFSFLVTFRLFYKERKWSWGVASSLLLGLNFYNYFYSWTFLYAFGGVLILFFLIQKKWHEALMLGSVFAGALVVAVPYGINLYRATSYHEYADTAIRNGIIQTHAPLFVGFVVIVALIVFFGWFPRENKREYLFGLALLLAPFITMNQQLFTGKILQATHYHWFFHKPIAIIFLIIIVFHLLARYRPVSYRKVLAGLIIIGSFGVGVFVQAASIMIGTKDDGAMAVERQQYGPVMHWLNQNAAKEAVVLSNDEISHLVVIYTPENVFYHRAGMYSLAATRERLFDTIFTFYRLRGVDDKNVRDIFFTERGYLSSSMYGIYYRDLIGQYEDIPDAKIEDMVTRYKATLTTPTNQWLKSIFAKYEVEYVVWDKKADPLWHLQKYTFLKEVASFGDIAMYHFVPQTSLP